MFGIRTPAKRTQDERRKSTTTSPNNEGKTGSSSKDEAQKTSVRRSIGEWENEKRAQNPTPSSSSKYSDRLAEAKACLCKAKLHLNNSRNLKTEIKVEVLQSIERLYNLVKEAEAERKAKEDGQQREDPHNKKQEVAIVEAGTENEERKEREVVLIRKLEENNKLITDNNKEMEMLREALKEQALKEQGGKQEKESYATITAKAAASVQPKYTAIHSVAVTSKNVIETGEEVLNRVRKAINARDEGLKIERVRKAKDQKVIIGCTTQEELGRVKGKLNKEANLIVEDIKNKDPLIVLKDVMSYNTDDDIIKSLRIQNKNALDGVSEDELRFEVRYRKRTRNPHTSHVVLKVSPSVWRRLTEKEMVHIDLQRVRVMDQSPLVQCTRCLGCGHSKKLCTETVDLCSHCGGPHLREKCEGWLSGVPAECKNCLKAKFDNREHGAFSADCPVRRKWEALARSSVAYC